MKAFIYNYREYDEARHFTEIAAELGVELGYTGLEPTLETAQLAAGYEYVSIITTKTDAELLDRFYELGVRVISTRSIGVDHIDCAHARELGMRISNATYPPSSVADYTIMMMLMAIRNGKRIIQRGEIQDFTLKGLIGRTMPDMSVGVIGTGRIGREVIRRLQGFGCPVYAYDLYESEEVRGLAQYVSLKEIYEKCDLITLHMPLTSDNFHMIDGEALAQMRDQVVLVNTARGSLIDLSALCDAIEAGKVGAAALDVVENEFGLYYNDRRSDVLQNRDLAVLLSYPNVVVTPHMAFYTEETIRNMIYSSLKAFTLEAAGEENPWRVI